MLEQENEGRKTISTDELSKMSHAEAMDFFEKNPGAEIDLPPEFWENVVWRFDENDPNKVISVGGPLLPKKVEE